MSADRYCVMGNPVGHSRSPWIHARFAQLTGQAVDYGRLLVEPGGFASAVSAFRAAGGKGCNVTLPFKFEAAALAARATPRARLARACNTLRFDAAGVFGDNTDGIGLVRDLTVNAATPLAGRDLLLIGAGGAGAGVLGPLLQAGPRRMVVANRTRERAAELVSRHLELARQHGVELGASGLEDVPGTFDVVVNGSASSLQGADVPVSGALLRPGALVCDMMYGAAAKGALRWALAHGAVGRDGLGMLVEQAAESFFLWRGVRPPSAQVLAELRVIVDGQA